MLRRGYHGSAYFSAPPLNYETLLRRRTSFSKKSMHSPDLLQDYIRANRKLQELNREENASIKFSEAVNLLGLKLNVPSSRLEADLWGFIQKYWTQCVASDSVVKSYVLTDRNVDINRAFSLVKGNFDHHLERRRIKKEPVMSLVNVLLRRNDYHNCFKLIDVTLNSPGVLQLHKNEFFKNLRTTGVLLLLVAGAQFWWMPLLPMPLVFVVDALALFGTLYGFWRMKLNLVGRISWRPHTSVFYRYLHQEVYLAVNKIITYFEEHSEVNVKNFHTSQVRNVTSLGIFHQNDYEMYLPQGTSLPAFTFEPKNDSLEHLTQYFRTELSKRKMVWNGLKEELLFLEFWVSHGENFEWVEPDQDPAEMANFREKESSNVEKLPRH